MEQDKKQRQQNQIKAETGTGHKEAGSAEESLAAQALEPGQMVFGRYKILSLIGRGAMGSVYRVEQVFLGKQFALKTLNSPDICDVSLRRFQNEAQAASNLEHPNLIRAVDFGLLDDIQPCLIMDLAEGQTLSQYLKNHDRLTVERALKIFVPLCFALDYAHKKGVIHRDIKPANIVLTECDETNDRFTAKIVDFGIAKQEGDGQSLTRTGEVFGTPLYMSPEQCCGVKVDNRSDIYSLGCVIYEALTGMPPFRSDNALQTMMQHRTELPLSLKEATLGIEFPPVLESAMSKMLAKDPKERYQSCEQLVRDLIWLQNPDFARAQPSNLSSNGTTNRLFNKPRTATENQPIRRQWVAPLAVALLVVLLIIVRSCPGRRRPGSF